MHTELGPRSLARRQQLARAARTVPTAGRRTPRRSRLRGRPDRARPRRRTPPPRPGPARPRARRARAGAGARSRHRRRIVAVLAAASGKRRRTKRTWSASMTTTNSARTRSTPWTWRLRCRRKSVSASSGMRVRAVRVRMPIGWPSITWVPAVTTCSGSGRPFHRASSMKPAITERAALPVQSTRSSVIGRRAGARGRPRRGRAARGAWCW